MPVNCPERLQLDEAYTDAIADVHLLEEELSPTIVRDDVSLNLLD